MAEMQDRLKSGGSVALVVAGVGSAFALASCCALPFLLVTAGLSPYWLGPIAERAEFHTDFLTVLAVLSLAGAAFMALRSPKLCAPGSFCARPLFRVAIVAGVAIGLTLLILSKIYA